MGTHHFHLPAHDPERRRREDPQSILNGLGLRLGQTLVDVGSGGGYYTIPAVEIVGPTGRVYAIDVNQESLDEVKEAADHAGLANITCIRGRAEETTVCESCADFVFYAAALHDFDDPAAVLRNARQMLKAEGHVVDLDWKKDALIGPPAWKRLSQSAAVKLIETAGFEMVDARDLGHMYLIVGTPKR